MSTEDQFNTIIMAVNGLADAVETQTATMDELIKALQTPPPAGSGSDLPAALRDLANAVASMAKRMDAMPAEVVRALR